MTKTNASHVFVRVACLPIFHDNFEPVFALFIYLNVTMKPMGIDILGCSHVYQRTVKVVG